MTKAVKIVCISDTHMLHEHLIIPDGDILIHAGDSTDIGRLKDLKKFNTFLGALPHKHKIVVAGNHDFCFEREPKAARAVLSNALYLEDEAITIEGIQFYGTPWQPWFYDWAFNLPRGEKLREKWALISEFTDILITHGPPYGHRDLTQRGEQVGCADLLDTVKKIKPKYHIFGHIHEAAGVSSNEDTIFVNASCCNFSYQPAFPPIVFDYVPRE
jgi:Icc-related predicted phosphoesterase